jgi:BCD family chlorophyll transporter-like MFS transporter
VVGPSAGYAAVYQIELLLLFITLIAIGPLVQRPSTIDRNSKTYGLAQPTS